MTTSVVNKSVELEEEDIDDGSIVSLNPPPGIPGMFIFEKTLVPFFVSFAFRLFPFLYSFCFASSPCLAISPTSHPK